ncbi:solute carrier family 53 member 1 isoform X2 [Drosophila takahashii]|uniref:solute carrier family 53 member 1 isoform X2 n=1 Tax=Drosophila takahashii TaxID=29030 RepID=UPI0038994697
MKFGKTFESHLTIEWRQQYMRYADLKALIKQGVENAPSPLTSADYEVQAYYRAFEETFLTECQTELDGVNNFFLEKLLEARRKHGHLKLQLLAYSRAPGHTGSDTSMVSSSSRIQKRTMTPRQLRYAYAEFYLSLVLIQNYQSLNETGFRKICKKYDKNLRSASAGRWFEDNVLDAPFTHVGQLQRMTLEVEDLYTAHLANGDRSLAMEKLRVPPLGEPTPPAMVFRAGIALGTLVMLLLATAISCRLETGSAGERCPGTDAPVPRSLHLGDLQLLHGGQCGRVAAGRREPCADLRDRPPEPPAAGDVPGDRLHLRHPVGPLHAGLPAPRPPGHLGPLRLPAGPHPDHGGSAGGAAAHYELAGQVVDHQAGGSRHLRPAALRGIRGLLDGRSAQFAGHLHRGSLLHRALLCDQLAAVREGLQLLRAGCDCAHNDVPARLVSVRPVPAEIPGQWLQVGELPDQCWEVCDHISGGPFRHTARQFGG